ncbi:MAG: GyrI-like domain-containing protein [Thermoanaerobaculia bacterium]
MTIDLFAQHASEYEAPATTPALVETTPATCLAIAGQGPPGGEEFDGALGAVMATAHAVEAAYRNQGQGFVVGKLEALWWTDAVEGIEFAARPRSEWKWKLLVRVPDFVDAEQVAAAARLNGERGMATAGLTLEKVAEGRCAQILHVGAYRGIPEAMDAIRRFAGEHGLQIAGRHHEICLTDPRQTPLENLRTIIRYPVR